MANVICFFSLNTLIEQVCFFNAIIGALIKQGNYIINAAEVKELLVSFSIFYYYSIILRFM